MSIADKLTTIAENEQKIYDKGMSDAESAMWDVLQENGKRTNYGYAFYHGSPYNNPWDDETFNPKYDMHPTSLERAFSYTRMSDFAKIFEDRGLVFDTSNCVYFTSAFNNTTITRLPTLDLRKAPNISRFNTMTAGSRALHTIDKMIFEPNGIIIPTSFSNNSSLRNIVIEGAIGVSFDMQYSPLTAESAKSVIRALINYAGTDKEGTCTLTLNATAWKNLNESTSPYEDGMTDIESLTWTEYVQNLGWLTA